MGHALANTVVEFGIARFSLGLGESGNFPAAIKTVAEWFPQKERSLATGIFNSGANIGVMLASLLVPIVTLHFGWHAAFLVTGLFSAAWIAYWFFKYRKPTDHPTLTGRGTALHLSGSRRKDGPLHAMDQVAWLPADLGLCHPQVPHRSHLVVLSLLAARPSSAPGSISISATSACR